MTLFLFCFFFKEKKREKNRIEVPWLFSCSSFHRRAYVSACVSYLHTGTKNDFRKRRPSRSATPCWASRGAGQPSFTRVHRRTFQRSACDCSASFVCTLTAEDWSSQCLKHTLLLASMTDLSTTVVMLCVFMSTSIVLIFFFL